VDAFEVLHPGMPTPTPTARPTSGGGTPTATATSTAAPTATVGPTATATTRPTATTAPTAGGPTRIENTDARVLFAGSWFTHSSASANHSGGNARLSTDPGDTATLTFTGTGIRWIGFSDPWAGIANVFIDGVLRSSVDTYSAVQMSRRVLYSLDGLSAGSHTIRIGVTGTRSGSSGGAWIWVDAFDVVDGGAGPTPTSTAPPTATATARPTATATAVPRATATPTAAPRPTATAPPTVQRIEQTDARVALAGTWFTHTRSEHSGGSAILAMDAGSTATLSFTGTGVRWIGLRDAWAGIAKVYVDGVLRETVDTYSAAQLRQNVLFDTAGLAPGPHTLRIEVTGTRNAASGGSWVWVDAFEVSS
jgi:hypothetical protein